nr:MAG TPA: TMEM240 family [Caudoviricetes sp.]
MFVSIINGISCRCSVIYIAHFLFGSFSYKGLLGFCISYVLV